MRAGLLGRTLGHSLSPQIHRFFGDYDYRLFEVEPDGVAAFVRTGFSRGDFDFLNVTIPYKQTVLGLCDDLSPMARRLRNANLLVRSADGRILGDNTDAYGFGRLLDSIGADARARVCAVLGAGGAALTAKAVLEDRGAARVALVRRGEEPSRDAELIVNATPVGMHPNGDGVRVDISGFPNCRWVLDLVYNPSPTRLVREARAAGKTAADGRVMLVAQAFRAFRLVTAPSDGRTLFLYGPPASGKSTWAKILAAATGAAVVDLDARISETAGKTIPDIFATAGERGFRALERRCLEDVCRAPVAGSRVVALGGGALLDEASRALAEKTGRIVVLDCPLERLKARLSGPDRPLSADAAALETLVRARAAHYASFAAKVAL